MIPQYVIMVTKQGSTISSTSRQFTEEQKQTGEMQKYIELKTKAGFVCHEFGYNATFQLEKNLVRLNP